MLLAVIQSIACKHFNEVINPISGYTIFSKEVRQMSRKGEIWGKGQVSGNNVSHSMRHTRRKWNANIQTVRINDNGTVRRANVCTRCMRSNKIDRAL